MPAAPLNQVSEAGRHDRGFGGNFCPFNINISITPSGVGKIENWSVFASR